MLRQSARSTAQLRSCHKPLSYCTTSTDRHLNCLGCQGCPVKAVRLSIQHQETKRWSQQENKTPHVLGFPQWIPVSAITAHCLVPLSKISDLFLFSSTVPGTFFFLLLLFHLDRGLSPTFPGYPWRTLPRKTSLRPTLVPLLRRFVEDIQGSFLRNFSPPIHRGKNQRNNKEEKRGVANCWSSPGSGNLLESAVRNLHHLSWRPSTSVTLLSPTPQGLIHVMKRPCMIP